ncbi:succinate CoA transferase [Pseudopedobacter saltans DSM 12145]|uniref:Succinate CoA transferase n=1 Tax=Pseudopedobacter saltans (strain ATCC 51119 / DSM 12145 / JCM 21818 / CCUG 39354 / LMG 10337 / NBRC 100064 / NCIMB 13643) TaxID=762903 RepID=F0S4G9_PSESL|nr:succinate CoA transferase [Pseudopedobacter saltans]ADY51960.1 succinate CoA transferase [Pseudopedobacter saltans DSM 12145]
MAGERILHKELSERIIDDKKAASFFKDKMVVASSGFTKSGDSKAVLSALVQRAQTDPLKITLMTGASLGHGTDGALAAAKLLHLRLPFQVDTVLRKAINDGEVLFIDQHLGETANLLKANNFPKIDIAILEAAKIQEDGSIIPTTSVGNSAAFAALADKIIIELNTSVSLDIIGVHDICSPGEYPNRSEIHIVEANSRVGTIAIPIEVDKVIGIVLTDKKDSPAEIAPADETTKAIAKHLVGFFNDEIKKGNLTKSLMPLQAGIGKVANAVLNGFIEGDFENLTMYSEVLQDSTFDLLDSGKLNFASGSSITVSEEYYHKVFDNFDKYRNKIILRPQDISNAAEVIRRLGVISINTALECDIYGNVNSTHIAGTNMMNGIGGSGDFARNAYLSVFVTQSIAKGGKITSIVPMVSHVDHTEHDVDIIVTEQGLADLRGLAPRQRAKIIIENCAHPSYRSYLLDYFDRACERGGQTPHLLEEAFDIYKDLREKGTMAKQIFS